MKTTNLGALADLLRDRQLLASDSPLQDPSAPERALEVAGAAHDSRSVLPGNLFVCKGVRFEARFLTLALEAGAVCYLCDKAHAAELAEAAPDVPALVVGDVRAAMPLVSRAAWGEPDRDIRVVGVTGSKGKTTTTYLLRSILDYGKPGSRAALLGSVEYYDGVESGMSENTTPEAPELWHRLANAADHGLIMIMEVSSQALKYGRVEGLSFDIAALTNIGRDHISPVEHPTLEDYVASKMRIFEGSESAVLLESLLGNEQVAQATAHVDDVTTFSVQSQTADVWASDVHPSESGTRFLAHTPEWTGEMELGIPGTFNVDNALCAIALALRLGANQDQIRSGLLSTRVPGRMERVASVTGDVVAIVDFAHNGQSFQSFFESIAQEYPDRYVVTVFGCTGVKGLERRRQTPPVACRYSDLCIYTEDDPGIEPLDQILSGMVEATPEGSDIELVDDRVRAIDRAVEVAGKQAAAGRKALVCVLGKGEEVRMLRASGPEPCEEDRVICERALRERDRKLGKRR